VSTNRDLVKAKHQKRDEFYTQLSDIEDELRHYRHHFKDKVVYCNCDDPRISNFFWYFANNFKYLGLKKLVTTCYRSQQIDLFSRHTSDRAIYLEYTGGGGRRPDLNTVSVQQLEGDGDFRSGECIELLKDADVVVTNPPFSLFREYLAQLIEHNKKFLILGQQNNITYRDTFPVLQSGLVWFGYENGGTKWFQVNNDYNIKTESRKKIIDGNLFFSFGSIVWFTNLDHAKRHEDLLLSEYYNPSKDPRYVNFDAIELSRVELIPQDWPGMMGVPITFLHRHMPVQFDIFGLDLPMIEALTGKVSRFSLNKRELYARIVIQNKKPLPRTGT